MSSAQRFRAGGAVPLDALYAARAADEDLRSALRRAEFCYVLTPRQMGKTSLMVRAVKAMEAEGRRCAVIDLTGIGSTDIRPDQWYLGLVCEVCGELDLALDPNGFWEAHEGKSAVHRWSLFLDQLRALLQEQDEHAVIFIDEIDGVIPLPFSADDFFASIRAVYNGRAAEPSWERITFCLLGVAAPNDLVRDAGRTPFNVGHPIELQDFCRDELRALEVGLEGLGPPADAVMDQVFAWTGGHPYMTQRTCLALVEGGPFPDAAARVEEVVRRVFIDPGLAGDINLATARDRFLHDFARHPTMLDEYRRILLEGSVRARERDGAQVALLLTGMTRWDPADEEAIVVRNRVFAAVFDRDWVRAMEGERVLRRAMERWRRTRSDEDLLRGAALVEARAWAAERNDLSAEESAFLLKSVDHAQRQSELEGELVRERAVRSEIRSRNRTLLAVLAGGAFVVTAVLAATLSQALEDARQAGHEAEQAKEEAEKAAAEALRFQAEAYQAYNATLDLKRLLGASKSQDRDEQLNLLREVTDRESREWAWQAVAALRTTTGSAKEGAWILAAEIGPDGSLAADVDSRGWLRVWEVATGTERWSLQVDKVALEGVAWSPDGREIAVASQSGKVLLVDVGARDRKDTLLIHHKGVRGVRYSPDGRWILSASDDGSASLIDRGRGRLVASWYLGGDGVRSAEFLPEEQAVLGTKVGHYAVVSLREPDLAVGIQVAPETWLRVLDKPLIHVNWLAPSPDGQRLVAALGDGTARILNRGGGTVAVLRGHSSEVDSAVFSPDGTRVLTAAWDGSVRIWDAERGEELALLTGHSGGVYQALFSPDQGAVISCGNEGRSITWPVRLASSPEELTRRLYEASSCCVGPERREAILSVGPSFARQQYLACRASLQQAGHTASECGVAAGEHHDHAADEEDGAPSPG